MATGSKTTREEIVEPFARAFRQPPTKRSIRDFDATPDPPHDGQIEQLFSSFSDGFFPPPHVFCGQHLLVCHLLLECLCRIYLERSIRQDQAITLRLKRCEWLGGPQYLACPPSAEKSPSRAEPFPLADQETVAGMASAWRSSARREQRGRGIGGSVA
ncbi:hypothetical protein [Salinicola lusitanus]|uniref:hypothetical protein n=1 Tax=Salinicola lusitanus TaxID=1949085 RepID=UPI000DA1C152|nr:hypothetical protein [Salinicola lusitanus]